MKIVITKGPTADSIELCRADGTRLVTSFPRKGPVPHDAVHFVVESELGIHSGFWGRVAGGRSPEDVAADAKAAGHASASRAARPDPSFVAAIQAERLVECFEADLWGGGCDPATFRGVVEAACRQSLVEAFPLTDEAIEAVRARLIRLRDDWAALPIGGSCTFDWPEQPNAAHGMRASPER
jgi:hypothetical protein